MTELETSLSCAGLSVSYGAVQALDQVSLEVRRGEVLALLGPSGSGKTTLLHAAAGFVLPSAGTIEIAGRQMSRPGWALPPEKRSVGLVFQSYALWPHLSARETVAYPLRRSGMGRGDALKAAQAWLERIGLGPLGDRRPNELSGGEQQRVGLARALAGSPALFLLDEPTANLDATLKAALQQEMIQQQRATGAGALYVTHDPAEAFAVADRVAVLRAGRLIQAGVPAEVYASPANAWVAALTGAYSAIQGVQAEVAGETIRVQLAGGAVSCPGRMAASDSTLALLRPEWVALGACGELALPATVGAVRFQGSFTDYVLAASNVQVLARQPGAPAYASGEVVSWQPRQIVLVGEE